MTSKEFSSLIGQEDTCNGSKCVLIGLHTCGDLASTMLKIFRKTDEIEAIVSVSCCYFRMTLKSEVTDDIKPLCCAEACSDASRTSTQKTANVDQPQAELNPSENATKLCCCKFNLRTLYHNYRYLQKTGFPETKASVRSDYGFPLSHFLHTIPVQPLKYKSFETACHFLGDYADKLKGNYAE